MTKTQQAISLLITKDYIIAPDGLYKIIADLMTNDLFNIMGSSWTISMVDIQKPHLKDVLYDIAFLMSGGILEHRHAKKILADAWDTDDYAWDMCWYLRDTKILDEKQGDELDDIILNILKTNDKVIQDIRAGKTKAIGSLIGPIMRITNGKANPKLISERVIRLVEQL